MAPLTMRLRFESAVEFTIFVEVKVVAVIFATVLTPVTFNPSVILTVGVSDKIVLTLSVLIFILFSYLSSDFIESEGRDTSCILITI